jgi:nucleoside-diphosphate-sugar epimerase
MRVLVTGGAGYIGSILVPLLLASGHRVAVLDLQDPVEKSAVEHLRGDLRDQETLRRAMRGAEAVVHLAAVSGRPACARHPRLARQTNVGGTAGLLAAAGGVVPVVLASSLSCYGLVPDGLCDESTPARPLSLYARTKLEAESLLRARPGGIALRLATVYGLSPRMRLDLLVNDFAHTLARGRLLQVFEPEARRAFLHVADAARAFLFAVENARRLNAGLYNVGEESQNLSKRELVEHLLRLLGSARASYSARGRDPDRRDYAVSFARFRAAGFQVRVGLEQGLQELVGAFQGA